MAIPGQCRRCGYQFKKNDPYVRNKSHKYRGDWRETEICYSPPEVDYYCKACFESYDGKAWLPYATYHTA